MESMRLSQLARRPRHHVGAVPEPGRQSPGILDRKPHSITPGAASPTPAGRTVTRWQPVTSRRPVFPRSRSMVVAALHVVEAESHGGCAPSVRGGRTSNDSVAPRRCGRRADRLRKALRLPPRTRVLRLTAPSAMMSVSARRCPVARGARARADTGCAVGPAPAHSSADRSDGLDRRCGIPGRVRAVPEGAEPYRPVDMRSTFGPVAEKRRFVPRHCRRVRNG